MRQVCEDPEALFSLVERLKYKPGWEFRVQDLDRGQGSEGLTLTILVSVPDSNNPEQVIRVMHFMIVPAAAYDERSWRHWLFEQIRLVESHEAAEFFMIDGVRVYSPSHGPGNDPYMIREIGTQEDASMTFRGEIK